uniref:Uncharacterized protein n=1 Tax=Rhizophora mucronata TaxID=61149 RepID=A0A2P2NU66_RHIMU
MFHVLSRIIDSFFKTKITPRKDGIIVVLCGIS